MDFTELKGNRIKLMEIGYYGLEDMHEYSVDPLFTRYFEYETTDNINGTEKILEKFIKRSNKETGFYWFIKLMGVNKIIGTFGLNDIDQRKGSVEIGYGISPKYWGKGYFKEALILILKFIFIENNFNRVWAKTQSNNIPSINGLTNLGFKQEGVMRDYYLSYTGKRHDALLLSMLRHEFLEKIHENEDL